MKKPLLLLLPVLLVLQFGCKKETYKTAPAVLKTISTSPSGFSTTFSYDANGRLAGMYYSGGGQTVITYASDTATEVYSKPAGNVVSSKIVMLSTEGLATNAVVLDGSGSITGFSNYTHSSDGYMLSELNYNAAQEYINKKEWEVSDGDVKVWFNRDTLTSENNFEFYYDHYYIKQTNTIGNPFYRPAYYGKSSGRLTKISKRYNYFLGNIRYSHTYTFDEFNRVSTEKVYDHNGILKYTNTYTYY
ncbi:MAG: hypothetical protein KIS94_13375 [Chitinophagales bacterium]|nr:hypothetical protein [Chitinophagales bacterium]